MHGRTLKLLASGKVLDIPTATGNHLIAMYPSLPYTEATGHLYTLGIPSVIAFREGWTSYSPVLLIRLDASNEPEQYTVGVLHDGKGTQTVVTKSWACFQQHSEVLVPYPQLAELGIRDVFDVWVTKETVTIRTIQSAPGRLEHLAVVGGNSLSEEEKQILRRLL